MTIKALHPQAVWHYFDQLTQIPRPSHQEEAVQQYVLDEAARLGLAAEHDAAGNVIIRKPASPGRENEAGVILQGHLDMVPQKNQDKEHDFSTDPITTLIAGDWVTADGTTLGADNGLGVAMILAVLADRELSHPPLEALFTANEETGMNGAKGLQGGVLHGRYLINLDYEDEGKLCIGCAGGIDGSYRLPYQTKTGSFAGYQLDVRGLRGGHSGIDIDKNRGNAVKILAQVLELAGVENIAHLQGGDLRNAIPREAQAIIHLDESQAAALSDQLPTWQQHISAELATDDQGLSLTLSPAGELNAVITAEDSRRLLRVLRELPNGVIRMDENMAGLVETSTNLAAVQTDGAALDIHCLLRSSNDPQRDQLGEQMAQLVTNAGGSAEYSGDYGGWLPQPESKLVQILQTSGAEIYGEKPEITAIHAGLECGILSTHYPHWEMASFGPTIESPHSPDERAHIVSVDRSYRWLCAALRQTF